MEPNDATAWEFSVGIDELEQIDECCLGVEEKINESKKMRDMAGLIFIELEINFWITKGQSKTYYGSAIEMI